MLSPDCQDAISSGVYVTLYNDYRQYECSRVGRYDVISDWSMLRILTSDWSTLSVLTCDWSTGSPAASATTASPSTS